MTDIVIKSEKFVREFLNENLPEERCFHNIDHAQDVVCAVQEIGRPCSLSVDDLRIVSVAAWFHDTGYCYDFAGHEESSIDIADGFLSSENCSRPFIEKVQECIWATRMPQYPDSLLEQVICDADLYHFSKANYDDYSRKLRKEWAAVDGRNYSDRDWSLTNLKFLTIHCYHTPYGKDVLTSRKQENIQKLRSSLFPGTTL